MAGVRDVEVLVKKLCARSDYDPDVIDGVVRQFLRLVLDSLESGYKVDLGALGSFVLAVHTDKAIHCPSDISSRDIYVDRIHHKIDDDFVREMRSADLEIVVSQKVAMTREERISNIMMLFETMAIINIDNVCEVNHCSRNVAGVDLQHLVRNKVLLKNRSRELATFCLSK